MRDLICLLMIAIGAGCQSPAQTVPPLEDSECVITVNPGIGGHFMVLYDHDLKMSPEEDLLSVIFVARSDNLVVETTGGSLLAIEPGVSYRILVKNPHSTSKSVLFRHGAEGTETQVRFTAYPASTPNQPFKGPSVVADYSVADGGMWLHIFQGSHAKHGVRILIQES